MLRFEPLWYPKNKKMATNVAPAYISMDVFHENVTFMALHFGYKEGHEDANRCDGYPK